jgi:hypothetical protein
MPFRRSLPVAERPLLKKEGQGKSQKSGAA